MTVVSPYVEHNSSRNLTRIQSADVVEAWTVSHSAAILRGEDGVDLEAYYRMCRRVGRDFYRL